MKAGLTFCNERYNGSYLFIILDGFSQVEKCN